MIQASQYKRVGILPVSYLEKCKNALTQKDKKEFGKHLYGIENINGVDIKIKLDSQRYAVFKNNLNCVCCGIKGEFLAIERAIAENTEFYHLNLYGFDKEGNEVMLTKDHILPKAKGGKNEISNYQTMCSVCNGEKRANTDEEYAVNLLKLINNNIEDFNNRMKYTPMTSTIQKEFESVCSKINSFIYV